MTLLERHRKEQRRHDGGAYRRYKTMVSAHAKTGKDRLRRTGI